MALNAHQSIRISQFQPRTHHPRRRNSTLNLALALSLREDGLADFLCNDWLHHEDAHEGPWTDAEIEDLELQRINGACDTCQRFAHISSERTDPDGCEPMTPASLSECGIEATMAAMHKAHPATRRTEAQQREDARLDMVAQKEQVRLLMEIASQAS